MSLFRIRQQGIDFQDGSRMESLFSIIPQGTKFLIHASTAPTGWTKKTGGGYNNAALRIVSQSAWVDNTQTDRESFTNAFKVHEKSYQISSTITGLGVGNHTLTTPQIPSHTHSYPNAAGGSAVSASTPSNQGGQRASMGSGNTGAKGGGGDHKHPVAYQTVKGPLSTTHDIAVRYVDVILCQYDGFTYSPSGTSDTGQ